MQIKLLSFLLLLSSFSFAQKKDYRWKYIANEDNLTLVKTNVTRTGVIQKVYNEADGDLHVWIDTGNKAITCEIICYKPCPICTGYKNTIVKPKVGQKIKVVGDYVYDNKHKWYEIHPVKSLKVIENASKN